MLFKFVTNSFLVTSIIILLVTGCATLPENIDQPTSYAFPDTDQTLLAKINYNKKNTHPEKSGFFPLSNGLDAFVARAVLAQKAERSIDAQYYLLHGDLTGTLFIDQLKKAAERGVRVRLLVDDMDLKGRDLAGLMLDSHPNIEVRVFNPFSRRTSRISQFLTRFGSVTRRMHNKSFTVDNQATILGGRNIGDEYFDATPDITFSDLDVLVIGPAVKKVSASFDRFWNNELAYPFSILIDKPPIPEELSQKEQQLEEFVSNQSDSEYMQALQNSDLANKLRQHAMRYYWGKAEIVSDDPEKIVHDRGNKKYHLVPKLAKYTDSLRTELIIFSPYFVPGKEGVAFINNLREKGVCVRILTNSLASTDVGAVHSGYAKYRKKLLRIGVELYELNNGPSESENIEKKGLRGSSMTSLHTKTFVYDREHVFIGSLNLDPRSFYENTEIGVIVSAREIGKKMGDWFDHNIGQIAFRLELIKHSDGSDSIRWHGLVDGEQKMFSVDPYTGFWRRFGVGFLSLLPIESQL